jgi:hypothetical protein
METRGLDMAHKTRESERSVRGKMTRPRDRGEKYVAPQMLPGEDAGLAWTRRQEMRGAVRRVLRRRRIARRGPAHDLIRKLDTAILQQLARS